jgi:membrane protein YdbS with pleckstrin-like domain
MENARRRAGLRALGRAMQWEPQTYKQAWLVWVFVMSPFLISCIIFAAFGYWPRPWPWGAAYSGVAGLLCGKLGYSIGLHRYRRRQR